MKQKSIAILYIGLILDVSFLNVILLTNINTKDNVLQKFRPTSSNNYSWNRTWDYGGVEGMGVDSQNNIILVAPCCYGNFKIIKVNSSGDELWSESYSRPTRGYDDWFAMDLALDSQDNIYVVGFQMNWWEGVRTDFLLTKFNSSGYQEWDIVWDYNMISNPELETEGSSIIIDSTDNIYVGINTYSNENILAKYDTAGNQIWNSSRDNQNETISKLAVDSLNNIYMSGSELNYDQDMFLLKFNSSGALQWKQTWGSNHTDYSPGLLIDASDNIYMSGHSWLWFEASDWSELRAYLMKINTSGHLQLNKSLGTHNYGGLAEDCIGNIYIVGADRIYPTDGVDICLAKFNQSETIEWEIFWGGKGREEAVHVEVDSNDNLYVAGSTYDSTTGTQTLLIKNPTNKTAPVVQKNIIDFSFSFLVFTIASIIFIMIIRFLKGKKEFDKILRQCPEM
ncbi:MAG: hypothetical protein ACFFD7_02050 [Candidatus Thorarchaeota archaeon]